MPKPTLLTFNIPLDCKGRTIDSFLRNRMRFSRRIIRSLKRENGLRINGEVVPAWRQLQGGEHLDLYLPIVVQNINPEPFPLTIAYEDSDLVIVNKTPGMLTHPVKKYQSGTLANALLYRWRAAEENCSFHPVNRLDRLTSGLVLIAKNPWIHQQLSMQLNSREISRLYLAFCKGKVKTISGKINAPIKEQPNSALRIIETSGKPAITRYRVIQRKKSSTLIAVKIFTGRTHQIRVHLSHLGFPLLGDPLYGTPEQDLDRTALHATGLSFIHPRFQERIKVKTDLPDDLKTLALRLGFNNHDINRGNI